MNDEYVIERIVELVPAVINRAHPTKRVCVLACRVGQQVGRYFGVTLKPLPVLAEAWNEKALDFFDKADGTPDAHDPEVRQAFFESGGWVVSTDPEDRLPGNFPAHLILLDDRGGALDLSLGQFARPAKDIVLPDSVYLDGFDKRWTAVKFDTVVMFYTEAHPAKDFRSSPDWKMKNHYAGQIIRQIRKELG